MNISQKLINKKLLVIAILVTLIFCLLAGRLFYIQVINDDFYITKAYKQWTRDLPFTANRGYIKDSNGIILASSTTTYTLYSRPNEIKDCYGIAKKISPIINISEQKLIEKLSKKGVSECTIKKNISKEQMINLVKEDIQGLYLTANAKRVYTYSNFLSQTLGFTNQDNVGQSGIELMYNSYLMGVDGASYTNTDLIGQKLNNYKTTYLSCENGMTINLTVDYFYQAFVEKAVNDALAFHDAKSVSCVMMDAKSGAIKAIAQAPSYDLNNPPRDDLDKLNTQSKLSIPCDVYEPGSTFKILTAAIAIEEHKVKNSYYCPRFSIVDGQRIKCWKSVGHKAQDFKLGIANSCNCVFMDCALSCGVNSMYSWYDKFGLFKKSGIDFPGEVSSIYIKKDNVKNVDLARIGFGQAIAITPIQLICAVCSVINGGNLLRPYIVKSIFDEKLNKYALKQERLVLNKTVSESTSNLMKDFLINVVENGGGKNAMVSGYTIGGKTGTSQKYENNQIARGKYISSFIGFTTVNDEDLVCLFLVDEPKGYMYYGSLVAAPYVKQIFTSVFEYKNITKASDHVVTYQEMPNLMNMSLANASALLKSLKIDFQYVGENGYVYDQIPAPGFKVSSDQIVSFIVG